jgi:hypothetical protein
LWGTIVEMEIEASIDRGVRLFSADFPSDCPPPSNLNDIDFEKASEQLPNERPTQSFPGTSFLSNLHKSRTFRAYLISLINNPKSNLQHDVLCHKGKLLQMIKDIPGWEKDESVHPGCSRPSQMLLDVQLRQLLLLLHSPWARQTESNSRYSYSRMVCINTAKHILEQNSNATKAGDYALLIFRNDVVRAALSFYHNFYISRTIRDLYSRRLSPTSNSLICSADGLSSLMLGCTVPYFLFSITQY